MAATGPRGPAPRRTLAQLIWGWGSAYEIGYGQDQWLAARRDGHGVLAARTLSALEIVIEADYRYQPVPREFDPPGSGSGTADDDEDAHRPGEDEGLLLAAMQAAFPAWDISYSTELRAWTARTRKTTICQGSPVLLCAALLLAERRYRQLTRRELP